MLTLLILAPIVLVLFVLLRLLFFPFHQRHHHGVRSYGSGWNRGSNRYDYNPYTRPRFGGLGSILLLAALERLFGRRW